MELKCNECDKISDANPKVKRMRNKIDKHYFECTHCNQVYLICYEDDAIKRERKKIRKLIEKNAGNEFYTEKIEEKEQLIKSKMNELKVQIETST